MPIDPPPTSLRTVYAVSELAELLRGVVEDSFPRVWVEGEISNLSRPASGHWYFTLKDGKAQLRAAMFRKANLRIRPLPENGDQVRVRAQLSFYTGRGDLQLICEFMESAGSGALLQAFEALKQRLATEGLFDAARKRAIPLVPRAIGVITSGTGAAVQDVLTTLGRRFPLAPVYLYPVPVQGEAAAPAIVRALAALPRRVPVDVVLLVRGGGSLEDLWAFNEESVARAIRACAVPVITGVGHETDTTIADFVADLRAPTPTAAAEHATPELATWRQTLAERSQQLTRPLQRDLRQRALALQQVQARLARQHPRRRLQDGAQHLDSLSSRLQQAILRRHRRLGDHLDQLVARLRRRAADARMRALLTQQQHLQARLGQAMQRQLERSAQRLSASQRALDGLSPLAVLDRGYAIVQDDHGHVIQHAALAQRATRLTIRLRDGRVTVRPISD